MGQGGVNVSAPWKLETPVEEFWFRPEISISEMYADIKIQRKQNTIF